MKFFESTISKTIAPKSRNLLSNLPVSSTQYSLMSRSIGISKFLRTTEPLPLVGITSIIKVLGSLDINLIFYLVWLLKSKFWHFSHSYSIVWFEKYSLTLSINFECLFTLKQFALLIKVNSCSFFTQVLTSTISILNVLETMVLWPVV